MSSYTLESVDDSDDNGGMQEPLLSQQTVREIENRLGSIPRPSTEVPAAPDFLAYLTGSLGEEQTAAFERCLVTISGFRHKLLFAKRFADSKQSLSVNTALNRELEAENPSFFAELEHAWSAWNSHQADLGTTAKSWWNTHGFEVVRAQAVLGAETALAAMRQFKQFGRQLAGALNQPSVAWSRGSDENDRGNAASCPCTVESVEVNAQGDLVVHIDASQDPDIGLDVNATITLSICLSTANSKDAESWELASYSPKSLPAKITLPGVGDALGLSQRFLPPDCIRISTQT